MQEVDIQGAFCRDARKYALFRVLYPVSVLSIAHTGEEYRLLYSLIDWASSN